MHEPGPVLISRSFFLDEEAATAAVVICRISHRRRPRSPVRARNKTRTDKTEPTPRDRDTSRDQTPGRFQEDDRRFWGFAVFLVSVYLAVFLVSVYTTARKKTSRSSELPAVRADRQSPRWPVAVREQPAIGPPGVVLCSVRAVLCMPAVARLAAPDTRFQ